MFVYVGVDKENLTIKVGITKQTVKQRLANQNVSQDNFYFEEHFSRDFTEEAARFCEKQLLKALRKKYDHVEGYAVGRTETFELGEHFDEGLKFAVNFVKQFEETDKEAYDKAAESKKKYDFSDFNRFKEYVGNICANNSFPLTERVTLTTLRQIHEAGMASAYTYACSKENKNWALNRFAREFVSRRTTELIESVGENEEHF